MRARLVNEAYNLGIKKSYQYLQEVIKRLMPLERYFAYKNYQDRSDNLQDYTFGIIFHVKTDKDLSNEIKELLTGFDDNLDLNNIHREESRSVNYVEKGIYDWKIPKKKDYWSFVKENPKMLQSDESEMTHDVVAELIDMANGNGSMLANYSYYNLKDFLNSMRDFMDKDEFKEYVKGVHERFPYLGDNKRKFLGKTNESIRTGEQSNPILRPKSKEEIEREFGNQYAGFKEAREGFEPFVIKAWMRDPGYGYQYVLLFLIKFDFGPYGLCIYDYEKEEFIEEPGTLDDYGLTYEEFMIKYEDYLEFI